MPNGRKGRYQIRKQISQVLLNSPEPLSAEQINTKLGEAKTQYRKTRRYRNAGYSNNSISQLLRGAQGVETSTLNRGREFNHNQVKAFKVTDKERFVTWVESKRRRR
tara:strand:+ start:192 stop:512 length:321 start_codon:yes stop_codon:yes gene_type:complete